MPKLRAVLQDEPAKRPTAVVDLIEKRSFFLFNLVTNKDTWKTPLHVLCEN